ncbi:hypothetical protein L227DRAFT_569065 [Lentinus tigrinus ALCF2SS1-6]|uniref:Uncharacterized protein n=2 Tax=Lentinus tigrinus TaxID=5365 RepID=A0A5C2SSI2_9APHY|nr:hypothetical protein L227DRAFT_569065 [Lentinus tigrinus ALCF2SS1-6]
MPSVPASVPSVSAPSTSAPTVPAPSESVRTPYLPNSGSVGGPFVPHTVHETSIIPALPTKRADYHPHALPARD